MDDAIRYEQATPGDLHEIRALLAGLRLPAQDVGDPHQGFIVARAARELVGCVGLERYGDDALLRSLAVTPGMQAEGIGTALYGHALAEARRTGVRALYLLTTTAEPFFARAGFARIERSQLPPAVAASAEVRSLCPASAACMRLLLVS